MQEIVSGEATSAQIAAFLTALRMKGETVDELVAFAEVMRENCLKIFPKVQGRIVDTCGTGGDKLKTFNISTTSAFVIAGAGIPVAKHGNRSITSKSGSADVLEKLGINLLIHPDKVKAAIEKIGIGFLFAPAFHPAMKYAVGPRKEVGIRTVFNILGPLTNPANAEAQLLGVYDPKLTISMAEALQNLGCKEAMVVHGEDGLDEVSTLGKTRISHLKNGKISTLEVTPKTLGLTQTSAESLAGGTPQENALITLRILNGNCKQTDPKLQIVLANSSAGIVVGGKADDFKHGVEIARMSIGSGKAYDKLKELAKFSAGDCSIFEEFEKKN